MSVMVRRSGLWVPLTGSDGSTPIEPGGTVPDAVTGLTATPSATSVVLSWSAAAGADVYEIRQDGTLIGTVSALTYTATGLASATAFTFTVTATNATGSGTAASVDATTSASSGFPDATNTGYEPTGVTLTSYGSDPWFNLTTAGAVIDSKVFNGDVIIYAANITIKRSWIKGRVYSIASNGAMNLLLEDCTINAGATDFPAVGQQNFTIRRCNITGAQHSVQTWGNIVVEDSWLHGQYIPYPGTTADDAWHVNGFITNGAAGIVLRHNTIVCDAPANSVGGGPTADVSIFGDSGQCDDILIQDNWLGPTVGGYGMQAGYNPGKSYPISTNVRVIDNTFERGPSGVTGQFGPYTAWSPTATGAVWSGNHFDDGTPIT